MIRRQDPLREINIGEGTERQPYFRRAVDRATQGVSGLQAWDYDEIPGPFIEQRLLI